MMNLIRTLALAVLTCMYSLPIWCQGSVTDQVDAAYKGKTLLLRNFYSGSDLRYDQGGSLVSGGVSGSWTLAGIEIKSLVFSPQEVEIDGNRVGARFLENKRELLKIGKVKIHVARPDATSDAESTLIPVLAKIFIDPGENLRAMLPEYWNAYLSGSDLTSRESAWKALVGLGPPGSRPSGSMPKVINMPAPKYTKEAVSKGVDGKTTLMGIVDASGNATRIGIVDALGMGLDEQAVLAFRGWKFRPSMSNGQPISVPAEVQIPFN